MRRIRGALGMGVTWAVGWALAGIGIGATSLLLPGLPWERFFAVFDAPLPALAIPGFFAGAFFSVVLGIAARRRRFHELSLARFAAWGAVGGLLLTAFPFALVAVGLASTEGGRFSGVQILAAIGGPFVLLSTLSAVGTLLLARRSERGASGTGAVSEASFSSATDAAAALPAAADRTAASRLDAERAARETRTPRR